MSQAYLNDICFCLGRTGFILTMLVYLALELEVLVTNYIEVHEKTRWMPARSKPL
jgi:hypothetical protein